MSGDRIPTPKAAAAPEPKEPAYFLQRKCACGASAQSLSGECEDCRDQKLLGLQAKLELSARGDRFEDDADRAADEVMSGEHAPRTVSAPLHLQRVPSGSGNPAHAPASVRRTLSRSGNPLDPGSRSFFESRFGYDFSRVRVHSGAEAAASARSVGAHAYTVGNDVVFGAGRYSPETGQGRRLIAHELAHVVQQAEGSRLQRKVDPAAVVDAATPLEDAIRQLPKLTQEQAVAVLKRWQKFIIGSIKAGEDRIHEYVKLRAESFGNYLIGGTVELLGWTSVPSDDWKEPWGYLNAAYATIAKGQVADSVTHLANAAGATRKHWQEVHDFLDKIESGADRSILALQALEVAGAAAITVLTAGSGTTAMVAAGTAYTGTQRLAGEATSVAIGLKDRIDFAGIAFDMLFAALMGKFLGQFAGRVANSAAQAIIRKVGESAARQVAAKVTAQLVTSLLAGRATGLVHAVALEVFNVLRGEKDKITVDDFTRILAEQLSLRAAFLDLVGAATAIGLNPKTVAPNPPRLTLVRTPPGRQGGSSTPPAPPPQRSNVVELRPRGGNGPQMRLQSTGTGDAAPTLQPQPQPVEALPAPRLVVENKTPAASPASVAPTAVIMSEPVKAPEKADEPKKKCPFPTGRTRADAIPIQWFKPPLPWFYPDTVDITRPHEQSYGRLDGPGYLPYGDPFGVEEDRWPSIDKIVVYKRWDRRERTPESDRVREMLDDEYGWRRDRGGLDVDHVQDPQWGLDDGDLDGAGLDHVSNMWPLSRDSNRSAGALQNIWQLVSYCVDEDTPRSNVPVRMLRTDRMWGRYFQICTINFTR